MLPWRWSAAWVLGVAGSFALPFVPPAGAWLVLGASLAVLAFWRRRCVWLWLALLLCAGAAYAVWHMERQLARQWPLVCTAPVSLTIRVVDLPQADDRRVRFLAEARDEQGRQWRLQLADYQLRDWPAGSVWRVQARLRAPVGEVNRTGFNREAWALRNGIDGTGTLGKARQQLAMGDRLGLLPLRAAAAGSWQRVAAYPDGTALMRALSIGEQSALSEAAWQAFRPLGLNHLVSISGLHVGMVALLAAWLAKRLLHVSPWVPARPKVWVLAAGLLAAFAYALLAGFSVPTQRAVLMLAVFAWVWQRRRAGSVWEVWWLALALVLLFDPAAVLGAGFWLSFGLVAALLWASANRIGEAGRGWRLALRAQLAVTVWSVVLLGTWFGALPLISPLVNALAIPWFSWILTPLALLALAFPWLPLQTLAAALAEYTVRFLVWLAAYAPEFGVAAAPLPLLLLAVVASLLLVWPRGSGLRPWAWLALAAFVLYRPALPPEEQARVTVWDVGQGLSLLVQTAGESLLFDTGTPASAQMSLLPNLRAAGVRRLDVLVLSHHDNDHDGGFDTIAVSMKPRLLLAGQPAFYPQAQDCHERHWLWHGVMFEFLETEKTADDNGQSCVLRVVAGGDALLVSGDLGQAGERALVARYGGSLFSQVLLLGHHGSGSSSAGEFLNAVAPQYAVASSGYGNPYRHPAPAVQARVRAHGIRLLRTDQSGGMVFELGSGEVFRGYLKVYKPYWQRKPFAAVEH